MATPADQRLLELLDKWLKSLELHLKYSTLDKDSYAKVQPWPEHQRPSRWIIELAKQKADALDREVKGRIEAGDTTFSESLELMTFLANLVGSEHIERFIPLAHLESDRTGAGTAKSDAAATREMPSLQQGTRAPQPVGTAKVARTERKVAEPAAVPVLMPEARQPDSAERPGSGVTNAEMYEQVIADAARLVQWGRKWYELAELISSMANRPSLIDVRRILKDNKTVIDKKAGRG